MAIPAELNRLLPRFDEAPTDARAKDFLRFLNGLERKHYEEVLKHLPDLLAGHPEEGAWEKFTDAVCYQSILYYTRFIMGGEIVELLSSKKGVGGDLYRLALLMSEGMRKRIVNDLLATEVRECHAFLKTYFKDDRPGMVDFAVEELLRGFKEEKALKSREADAGQRRPDDTGLSRKKQHDEHILLAIQDQRRRDPNRLPVVITMAYDVRFLAEEVHRELFAYPQPNEASATRLIDRILAWFANSLMLRSTRRNVSIYLIETGFFQNLKDLQSKIGRGGSYQGHWNTYIHGSLRSEKFWHDIAGLNLDFPSEKSEAGARVHTYQRAALVGGLIFAGLLVLPLAVKLAFTTLGAAIRLVEWTGSQLLLATQYSFATIKTFGYLGGTARMARDGFNYYMQNAVTINQRIVDLVEFFLDVRAAGTGMAPGSSPADMTRYVTSKLAVLAGRKSLPKLVSEAKAVSVRAKTEVDLVQVMVEDSDHKVYKVVAKVSGFRDGKIKLTRLSATDATGTVDEQARKTITFFGKPQKAIDPIADPRATRNNGVTKTTGGGDPKALDRTADAANAGTAGKLPVAEKTNARTTSVVDLAHRKQSMAEKNRQEAEKLAENLAQKAALKQMGERKVANAPDTVVIDMTRKRQGGGDRAVLGHSTPAQGGGKVDAKARSTGGAKPTQDSKGIKDRARGGHLTSVPAKEPRLPDQLLLNINIHTTQAGFRKQLVDVFEANPNHPLIALYDPKKARLRPSTRPGMDEFYWHEHPEAAQAGHVTSKHSGAPDKIVIMTAFENQMLKSTIEGKGAGASISGGFKVAIIDGIPISVTSAEHMIQFRKLDPKALKRALIVSIDDLDFPPEKPRL